MCMKSKFYLLLILGVFLLAGCSTIMPGQENDKAIEEQSYDSSMSEAEARKIAEATCIKGGESLDESGFYNPNSKTWWYRANLNATPQGCNPACVVHEDTGEAEINWMCTGAIVPEANLD